MEEEEEKEFLKARDIAKRLHLASLPWDREEAKFNNLLGERNRSRSVSIEEETFRARSLLLLPSSRNGRLIDASSFFQVGDFVFVNIPLGDRKGLGGGLLGGLGW